MDSRPLVCAALSLCRCQVHPELWAKQFAQSFDHSAPTTHLEMLQAVVDSRFFQTEADDDMKNALERFLPAPGGAPYAALAPSFPVAVAVAQRSAAGVHR